MNASGKSDGPIVPRKPTNKGGDGSGHMPRPAQLPAESVEGRGPAKGNSTLAPGDRTQSRASLHAALKRIRTATGRDKQTRLTALWHHVYDVGARCGNPARRVSGGCGERGIPTGIPSAACRLRGPRLGPVQPQPAIGLRYGPRSQPKDCAPHPHPVDKRRTWS